MEVSRRLRLVAIDMSARLVWQHCGRVLEMSQGVIVKAVGFQSSKQFVSKSWNDCIVSKFRRFLAGEEVRSGLASGEILSQTRHCNSSPFGVTAGQRSAVSKVAIGRNCGILASVECSHLRSWNRVKAMQLSTLPIEEQQRTTLCTEGVTSAETIVSETESFVPEFIPEAEAEPCTPLVQAIQSQDVAFTEESSTAQVLVRNDDLLCDLPLPLRASARPLADTDRQVHPGRVYVGGLPFSVKGDALIDGLRELFSKHGTVVDVHLAQHRHQSQKSILSGKHRGFAFMTMETPEQALEVIDELNGTAAWGRIIMVSHGLRKFESEGPFSNNAPLERKKVFVGNLHEGTTRIDLMNRFQEYGTIEDIKLIEELHSGRSRGFGFITFSEEAQAMKAVLDLDGSILDGSVIRVNIAKYPQGY